MRKLLAAVCLASLVGHAAAQTQPPSETQTAYVPCAGVADSHGQDENRKDGAAITPCGAAGASNAATGSLTPVYVGASVVATAVIPAAIDGGGNGRRNDGTPGTNGGGTTGTTGTTGTR